MPPETIIVTFEEIERRGRPGRYSVYWYRRFRVESIDGWGVAVYSPVIERSRDVRAYIARILELKLTGLHEGAAVAWLEENSPVWIPTSEDHESIATLANPLPPI